MKNINFDNPYLLLVAIPLLILTVIPYLIAIKKDNRTVGTVVSFITHIVVVLIASLAVAGTTYTTVVTKTEVYVVADVSYSSDRNLGKIDACIDELMDKLPDNSQVGVVCFAKDYQLLTPLGEEFTGVKDSTVDISSTEIAPALDYTATLFSKDSIKHIVLITDGRQTAEDGDSALVRSVENLYMQGIYIDAVYVDANLTEDSKEVQISGVEVSPSTYLNHEATADVLIRTSSDTRVILSLMQDGEKLVERAETLTAGFNIVNMDLPTDTEGNFDYTVSVNAEEDYSPYNNEYFFSQSVSGELSVLMVGTNQADLDAAAEIYGDGATLDTYLITAKKKDVPCTVEELCKYDEILLANVDVRQLNNFTTFISSVDKVVSLFGKSLVVVGDTKIQNKTDDVLKQLEDMLPVKYGNNDRDPKLYAIVIDTSRSMENAYHLIMAREAAKQYMGLMTDEDYVCIVSFSGEVTIAQPPIKASKRQEIAELVDSIKPTQGTFIGKGLSTAFDLLQDLTFSEKHVMLISDGMTYTLEPDDPVQTARNMLAEGIVTSCINTQSSTGADLLTSVAEAGGGEYYFLDRVEDVEELMLSEVADDVTETVIEKQTAVDVVRTHDSVLVGVEELPDIYGYIYSKAKASATTVLSVEYTKASGGVNQSPLYAWWSYGNGRVASYTGALSGEWVKDWQSGSGRTFLENILTSNIPEEKHSYPYTLNVNYDGTDCTVEIIPAVLNPDAVTEIEITLPSGEKISETLAFNSSKYVHTFETLDFGRYSIKIVYSYAAKSFEAEQAFALSYSPEYDSFVGFSASPLYKAIRNYGTVSEGSTPAITNDPNKIATYVVDFTVPFMIAAVTLYVLEIIFRKLRFSDIRGLFGRKGQERRR